MSGAGHKTVFLTQNISNYHVAFGGGVQGKSTADSLLALLSTKIFHASNDPITNEWASELIGKKWVIKKGMNASINPDGIRSGGMSATENFEYEVPPRAYTVMKTGGEANNLEVEAIITTAGRVWKSTGATYLKTTFKQGVV